MKIFCSDLDNTLIYSYRHDIGVNKKCVERYKEREFSFIDAESLEILKRIQEKTLFVPVTSRTKEQYDRISFGIGTQEYALVCNGGILLRDGEIDHDWYKESLNMVWEVEQELGKSIGLLEKDTDRCFEIRYIEHLFVFTKSNAPISTVRYLRSQLDNNKVDVLSSGTKVYVLPKELNKGNGILRLKERLGAAKMIAGGDSELDIPMLLASDIGLCPKGLLHTIHKNIFEFPKEVFTVEMLRKVESLGCV